MAAAIAAKKRFIKVIFAFPLSLSPPNVDSTYLVICLLTLYFGHLTLSLDCRIEFNLPTPAADNHLIPHALLTSSATGTADYGDYIQPHHHHRRRGLLGGILDEIYQFSKRDWIGVAVAGVITAQWFLTFGKGEKKTQSRAKSSHYTFETRANTEDGDDHDEGEEGRNANRASRQSLVEALKVWA